MSTCLPDTVQQENLTVNKHAVIDLDIGYETAGSTQQ